MNGSKTTSKTDLSRVKSSGDFVWDGRDEDERPLSPSEMRAGAKNKGDRPRGRSKESTTIRFDSDVLAALKESGPGWQTRVNELVRAAMALREVKP